jgi:hypothetical protein
MKKYFLTFILMVLYGTGHALPVGNPADPMLFTKGFSFHSCRYHDWWTLRLGFYGDYVFEHHGKLTGNGSHLDLPHTGLNTNAGLLVANLWRRCDLFATLGASHLFLRANRGTLLGNSVFLDTESSFSWSLGGKFILFQGCNWFAGVEGQYFTFSPRINFIRNEAIDEVTPTINYPNKSMHYREWQAGVSLAYAIGLRCGGLRPIPYIGAKWSNVRADLGNLASPGPVSLVFGRLEEPRHIGFAVGVTLIGCCRLSFNIEGRFADERAFALNSQYRF